MNKDYLETMAEHIFEPVERVLKQATNTRACRALDDFSFMQFGLLRVLKVFFSGRHFVQHVNMRYGSSLSVSLFFKALGSRRRRLLTEEVAEAVRQFIDKTIQDSEDGDPLAKYPELDGFAIYATDGHTHKASAREKPRFKKVYPVTHIYSLNLRTHTAKHDVLLQPEEQKKKEHEIKALKRMDIKALRMNEPRGAKVIHVYDPAVIDYHKWLQWKQGSGIYIVTMEKKNSAFEVLGKPEWDRSNPINNGVLFTELVGTSNGVCLRRIGYQDPASGIIFSFITNEMTLSPGIIAFLYYMRWNVEKLFDEFKNSLYERKAWSATENGKIQQANLLAMAHNLMILTEHDLKHNHGIEDQKVKDKKEKALAKDRDSAQKAGRPFNKLIEECCRATKRSLQFVRWFQYHIGKQTSWHQSIQTLRPLMLKYLQ